MSKNGWMGLEKSAGVGFERPKDVIKFSSPSLNWLFGSYGGVPRGFSAVFWGQPRGGKSVILWDAISTLHKTDPEARAILFDTEMRSMAQSGGATSKGVDPERLLIKATNDPIEIFDFIEKDVPAAIDAGLKLPLIMIDSISMIRGLKSLNADTVGQHLIGDEAQTVGNGFKRILPVLRRKNIAMLCTSQARAELDATQQRMHKTMKMSLGFVSKHLIEFFVQVNQVEAKDGKIFNEELTDANDNALVEGNMIRITMNESSFGGKGRTAEVMLSYKDGFIQIGKEVANLAVNLGVIRKPEGQGFYIHGENKYRGMDALTNALEQNSEWRNKVVEEIMTKTKTTE